MASEPSPLVMPRGGVGSGVRLEGVTRAFPVPGGAARVAVDGVSLRVEPSAVVALMGPSGSGKSTLLHMVGAIEVPDSGRVLVDGRELAGLSRRELAGYRRGVGFVFQRFNLLPALTALDNVITPVLPVRTDFDKHDRARELLAAVGLGGREQSLPSRLSGGEQQRVAIARALMGEPRLVLADEPTGNLDSTTGDAILDLLMELRGSRGMTLIIATHDHRVAERCDRVVGLRDGRVAVGAELDNLG